MESSHPNEAILELNSKIILARLDCENLSLFLDNGDILKYDVDDILREIGVSSVSLKYNHITKQIFDLNEINSIKQNSQVPRGFCIFYGDNIISAHNQNLYLIDTMDDEKNKVYEFNTKISTADIYADFIFQKELLPNETITVSALLLFEKIPFYMIGTSQGRILASSCIFEHEIIIYSYHKSPITCVYLYRQKFISCSCDNLLCVWNFQVHIRSSHISEPEQILNIWCSPIKTLISVECPKDTMPVENEVGIRICKEA